MLRCLFALMIFLLLVVGSLQPSQPLQTAQAQSQPYPLWKGRHAEADRWTSYAEKAIETHGVALLAGARDVTKFCPRFAELSKEERRDFWIQLVAAVTKYESGFNPTLRFVESTMGIDPVTGKRVVSEGLLQLSYQDELTYRSRVAKGVCDFDYQSDRLLPVGDPRRSILQAELNLTCGIAILNHQIKRHGQIVVRRGAYWAVLKSSSRSSKVSQIRSITRALNFCH